MLSYKQFLIEKLIVFNGGKKYGQVVFMAGGAGSGKGFSVSKFMEGDKFKVRDVDEYKRLFLKLNDITKQYPEIAGLNLRNPDDVFKLHEFVSKKKIKQKTLDLLLAGAKNKETLPNILFDITLQNIDSISTVLPSLLAVGYKPENIHLVWTLTNYAQAVKNNATRDRVVPDDILLATHEGAASTMFNILKGNIPKGLNGRISVILNNREMTTKYELSPRAATKNTSYVNVKDFSYIDVKQSGKPMMQFSQFEDKLRSWIEDNIPKSDATRHIFRKGA